MRLFNTFRAAAAKRAQYYRTLDELRSMDDQTARDLGVNRYDFPAIAYRSVYGA